MVSLWKTASNKHLQVLTSRVEVPCSLPWSNCQAFSGLEKRIICVASILIISIRYDGVDRDAALWWLKIGLWSSPAGGRSCVVLTLMGWKIIQTGKARLDEG